MEACTYSDDAWLRALTGMKELVKRMPYLVQTMIADHVPPPSPTRRV